jgi:hypothetical protein
MSVIVFLLVFLTHTIYNVTSYRFRVSSDLSVKCFIDTGTENNLYVLLLLSVTPGSSAVSLHGCSYCSALTSFCEFFSITRTRRYAHTHTHTPVGGGGGYVAVTETVGGSNCSSCDSSNACLSAPAKMSILR